MPRALVFFRMFKQHSVASKLFLRKKQYSTTLAPVSSVPTRDQHVPCQCYLHSCFIQECLVQSYKRRVVQKLQVSFQFVLKSCKAFVVPYVAEVKCKVSFLERRYRSGLAQTTFPGCVVSCFFGWRLRRRVFSKRTLFLQQCSARTASQQSLQRARATSSLPPVLLFFGVRPLLIPSREGGSSSSCVVSSVCVFSFAW